MYKLTLVAVLTLISMISNAQTKIIAHRGFSGIAPENTLIAFQKAIDCGADYFELDVHQTIDDSIVVIHDESVNRTSSNDMKGLIAEMTYSELAKVKVGYPKEFGEKYNNEKIPTLREALAMAQGKIKVCIEIKVYGVEKEVIKIVNDLGVNEEVIIFSFYYPVLEKIRQMDKDIPITFLKTKANKKTIDEAIAINANVIGVGSLTRITKEYLEIAHESDLEVWRWTVNKEDKMQELIELGIDGLITNFPDKALTKIKLAN
ncbi:MAG: hypothetical protein KAS71_17680 [Bacteroidales bacterium]|nr:hypothetical protein [Bacteroidales bacterium]